jgi:hypothetical protein
MDQNRFDSYKAHHPQQLVPLLTEHGHNVDAIMPTSFCGSSLRRTASLLPSELPDHTEPEAPVTLLLSFARYVASSVHALIDRAERARSAPFIEVGAKSQVHRAESSTVQLFGPQRDDWIDARRGARRQIRSRGRNNYQQHRHKGKRLRIVRGNLIEE